MVPDQARRERQKKRGSRTIAACAELGNTTIVAMDPNTYVCTAARHQIWSNDQID